MNSIFVLSCLIAIATTVVATANVVNTNWKSFKTTHKKSYENVLEESMRRAIFEANKEKVEHFNKHEAEDAGFSMGLNHLSDRTEDELKALNGFRMPEGFRSENRIKAQKFLEDILALDVEVPDELDWRKVEGRVSDVKDQGTCGGCWAFSATGGLEGQMKPRNKTLIPLSEQNLIDCSKQNHGCNGGSMYLAYLDISKEGGIEDEGDYPFHATDGECSFSKNKAVFDDSDAAILKEGDEKVLKEVVAKFGPVPIGIDASHRSFQLYKGGIYYERRCSQKNLDHAVLIVGYGTDPKKGDYWIVKNSWSDAWGENGYIRMTRNRKNNCGIASAAMIPTF